MYGTVVHSLRWWSDSGLVMLMLNGKWAGGQIVSEWTKEEEEVRWLLLKD